MPGVDVFTDVVAAPAARIRPPGATYFVSGITERGSTTEAKLLRSLKDYEYHYGDRVSYGALYDDLRTFFSEGGGQAYVGRVVGPAATVASRILVDRAGAPLNTIRIDAVDAGAWGLGITVQVADGTPANTFTITISYDGISEVYPDLADPAAAVIALARSRFVRGVNLGSVTAPPTNNPAVLAASALNVGGADDRASVVAADYITVANNLLGGDLGPGAVAVPGQLASAMAVGLLAHGEDRNRIALLATAAAQTPAQAKATAAALKGSANSEFGGLFYPWVTIPTESPGSTRSISPEGFVAAARTRAHLEAGPWRAPAGQVSEARFVVGLERELPRADGDDLNTNHVSAIRTIAHTTRLYGWRSLSIDTDNWALLTGRDTFNIVVADFLTALEAFAFRTIDSKGALFAELEGTLIGIVESVRVAGGIYELLDDRTGELVDNGYRVDTSPAVNTPETIALGQIRASAALRISPTGELVIVTVSKAQIGVAL